MRMWSVVALILMWGAEGQAVPDDWDRLASEDSCERGLVSGCYNLAVDTFNAGDRVGALEQFQIACDKKFALACFQVGVLKETDPTAPDLMSARESFKKAAALGHAGAEAKIQAIDRKLNPPAPRILK